MNKHRERRRSRSRSRDRRPSHDSRDKSRRRSNEGPDRRHSRHNDQGPHRRNRSDRRDNREEHLKEEWGKPRIKREKDIKTEPVSPKNNDESKKDGPNFALSGKLAEDTNIYNGIVIKYNEPSEARKPKRRWRLYIFKGDTELPMLPIHRQSAYLLGRERRVADIPIDHPSCSKQHAVLQYRVVKYKRDDETIGQRVRPYIIDLESANGTYVNNNRIEPRRYVELMEKDVIKFGFSSREYVVLHEESKDEELDDNIEDEENAAAEQSEAPQVT